MIFGPRRSERGTDNDLEGVAMRLGLCALLAAQALCFTSAVVAAEPIRIGVVNEITGPNAEAGSYTVNGAKLALEEINQAGGVLGRQLELRVEDNQSTNPGTVLAFSKVFGEGGIAAIIGPVRSTQVQAASPTITKAGIPVLIGGTDPGLTRAGNRWLFRARPNDTYSSKVIADFGVNTLKLKNWAILHSTDTFGTGGKNALIDELKALGVVPTLVQGYANNTLDFTPIVLAIKQSGADVLGTYFTSSPDVGIFANQLRQLGVNITVIGSPTFSTDTAMKLAREALHGVHSIADFASDSSPEAQAFATKYKAKYNREPDLYSSWAFDAVNLIALAIKTAESTDPEAMRTAILGIKGTFRGAEGTYSFDERGDGLHGYNIVRNEDGKLRFIKHIEFTSK